MKTRRIEIIEFDWLGPSALVPYPSIKLPKESHWRYATLVKAPVPFLLMRRIDRDESAQIVRIPDAFALRMGRSYCLENDGPGDREIFPCALPPAAVTGQSFSLGGSGYRGDLASVNAAQATAQGGASTPTITWNDRKCVVILSHEPLNDPGRVYFDAILNAASNASPNYMLTWTLRGLRDAILHVDQFGSGGSGAQTISVNTQSRKTVSGEPAVVLASFPALAVGSYGGLPLIADHRTALVGSVTGAVALAAMLDVGTLILSSTLQAASARIIFKGEAL